MRAWDWCCGSCLGPADTWKGCLGLRVRYFRHIRDVRKTHPWLEASAVGDFIECRA